MARRDLAVTDEPLHRRWELEQAQRVRDGGPALADPVSDGVVGEVEVLDELLIGGGLVERVEVLPVEVLDEGLLEARRVVGDLDERRD